LGKYDALPLCCSAAPPSSAIAMQQAPGVCLSPSGADAERRRFNVTKYCLNADGQREKYVFT